jgi:hypothetical protein
VAARIGGLTELQLATGALPLVGLALRRLVVLPVAGLRVLGGLLLFLFRATMRRTTAIRRSGGITRDTLRAAMGGGLGMS